MAADQAHLKNEIDILQPHCAGFHIDVMDNKFVPNITWNATEVNEIVKLVKNRAWLHLMVQNPEQFYDAFILPNDSLISFHIEAEIDVHRFVKIIREKKQQVSIAIRSKTPLEQIFPFLDIVDQVLVMSVEPGFSGQPFLQKSFERFAELIEYRKKIKGNFRIGVDGGVDETNIQTLVKMGVDDYAIASAIFNHQDRLAALQDLQKIAVE